MATICLLIRDTARCGQLAAALRTLPAEVIVPDASDCAVPGERTGPDVDVIVSDEPLAEPPARLAGSDGTTAERNLRRGAALVAWGWDGPADVVLPADALPRELVLACSLLAQLVRLRHEHAEERTHRQTMRQLAYTDELTGIANRRAWNAETERRIEHACHSRRPLTLALLDLDQFKPANEQLGYAAGDAILKAAARALAGGVRTLDVVARLGGDEFGLLLADVQGLTAQHVVERIRQSVMDQIQRDTAADTTASAGLACLRDGDTPATLFDRADQALRLAKRMGRNRTVGE